MDFDGIKAFIKDAGWGYLATTNGQRPAVRPMGAVAWIGGEFCCATGAKDAKTEDVKNRPHVEYCFADKEGRHVRMLGTCEISTDTELRAKLIEIYPFLGKFFKGPDDPEYVVLKMKPTSVRFIGSKDMKYDEIPID